MRSFIQFQFGEHPTKELLYILPKFSGHDWQRQTISDERKLKVNDIKYNM